MVRMNVLVDALNSINSAERRGKGQVPIRPCSQVIIRFLTVRMRHGCTGEFKITDDNKAGKIVVNLTGRLNKCGVISPRLDVQLKRPREVAEQSASITAVWFHCADNLGWHHGPKQARQKHTGGKSWDSSFKCKA